MASPSALCRASENLGDASIEDLDALDQASLRLALMGVLQSLRAWQRPTRTRLLDSGCIVSRAIGSGHKLVYDCDTAFGRPSAFKGCVTEPLGAACTAFQAIRQTIPVLAQPSRSRVKKQQSACLTAFFVGDSNLQHRIIARSMLLMDV